MAHVQVRGAGHPGDPFQVIVSLTENDLESARAPEAIILDSPDMGYDADPQVRTVIVQVEDS